METAVLLRSSNKLILNHRYYSPHNFFRLLSSSSSSFTPRNSHRSINPLTSRSLPHRRRRKLLPLSATSSSSPPSFHFNKHHFSTLSPHAISTQYSPDVSNVSDEVAAKYGFEKVSEEFIGECKSKAVLFKHKKTGAEVMSVSNDDENKVFGIVFRTPPKDSTGIPHILEHSVLCGSRKYPLKEPFVELLKGSLHTFLNAFTYPDRTCYPVASTNTKDFYNLVDVYLDAVFFPKCVEDYQTFQQEGWHFELNDPSEEISYKGVVFNEMKGVYSQPDNILGRTAQQALFPDNTYGVDSGGDPKVIPKLTFEQFKEFHGKYYHPSNARIWFYGDDDPTERLRILSEYLDMFDASSAPNESRVEQQKLFSEPVRIIEKYPAGDGGDLKKKHMVCLNWLLADKPLDLETELTLGFLDHLMLGTPASPLRKILLESGLGDAIVGGGIEDELLQPQFSIGLKGVFEEDIQKVEELVMSTLKKLAEEGFETEAVEASMNTIEFSLRENNTGSFPRGLSLMLRSMSKWIYDLNPFEPLKYEKPLMDLKARIAEEGYKAVFSPLIEKFILNNPHRVTVEMQPDPEKASHDEAAEREILEKVKASMTEEDLAELARATQELKLKQETPDPPEALRSVPSLVLCDIPKEPMHVPTEVGDINGVKVLKHDLFTNDVLYAEIVFNMRSLKQELLPLVPLFCQSLLEMGTKDLTFVQLNQLIGRKTGGISVYPFTSSVRGREDPCSHIVARGKAMAGRVEDLFNLVNYVLQEVQFTDQQRFKQFVSQSKARMENRLRGSGHGIAAARMDAKLNVAGWISEQMGGVSYLEFLKALEKRVDQDWAGVSSSLEEIRMSLFSKNGCLINMTADGKNLTNSEKYVSKFLDLLPSKSSIEAAAWNARLSPGNEAIVIPTQVNYVGKAANIYDTGYQLNGSAYVISKYISNTWLWDRVRVSGGAYGGFCDFDTHSGVFSFLSYRDPNLLKTLDVYDGSGAFLRELEMDDDALTKAIIGTIGDVDSYQLADAKGYSSLLRYLLGITEEERQKRREEILSTSLKDFKEFGEVIEAVKDKGVSVVVASPEDVHAANKERYSNVNEVTSTKNAAVIINKSKPRKRKLSEMLGPQWGKEELERFYKAYRKHGKDWEKVAAAVRNRSVEMVEALYTMNKAYLSLPKGFASAAGLIAMMTDHYSNLGESDSEIESNGGTGTSRKSHKRARVTKGSDAPPVPDLLQSQPAASNYGCLSLLKKRRTGSKPWAVGKRTPRVPVTYSFDKYSEEKYVSPIRQGLKVKADAVDDDVAHEIALALTEASQRGGSPQVSQTPKRKTKMPSHAQHDEQMHAESEMMSAKLRGSEMEEVGCELSLGSTEADVVDYVKDESFWKAKRYYGRRPPAEDLDDNLDDVREACSGTEEGQKLDAVEELFEMEVADTKLVRSSKGSRKRSKKVLFGEVEDADFDALEALADLSLRLPETPVDTGSSVYVEEEKTGIVAKSKLKGNPSSPGVKSISFKTTKQGKVFTHNASSIPEEKDAAHQFGHVMRKRRQKHLPSKISENEEHADSYLGESQKVEVTTDDNNFMSKGKRSQYAAHSKQGKLMKSAERTSSSNNHGRELNNSAPTTIQVLSASQFNLPTKVRSSRKLNTPKMLVERDSKSSENIVNSQSNTLIPSFQDRVLGLKGKLSNCLSRYLVRRWCVFEWFYSAIDYPWFSKREFVEYLEHVRLGHIPRLTRVEWGVIRSSLGKPRRFSEQFLKEEKEKLNHYRESVREHYAELRTGTREGLPTDLARPLSVGQRIIALHPRTSEIHDGSILTVDHSRCHVQFDRPELGVEFVMDVDCMPLNPLENMPASIIGHNIALNRYMKNLNELKISGQPAEKKMEGFKFSPCENLEGNSALPHTSLSTYHCSVLLQQPMGGLGGSNSQVNNGGVTVNTQQATNAQPLFCAQIQAKEADIHALSELTRALDKKEAVVSELKHMNDEVFESQKHGENSLKDSEAFKKHYAAVLLQLNEVNEQVSSALSFLRQRNTYQGNIQHVLSKSIPNIDEPACHGSSFDSSADDTQESGSHVVEIVESSRTKAQTMVDAAMQAMSSLKMEGSSIESIEDAIDFVNNKLLADDLSVPAIRSPVPASSVQDSPASQDQLSSCAANPGAINHAPDAKWNNLSNENEVQIPSELISHCVATLLMIQKCTERQFPPSHVAQVLDSAVISLKPCCSVNLPIYAEIQKFMGIIKNQILALIPT